MIVKDVGFVFSLHPISPAADQASAETRFLGLKSPMFPRLRRRTLAACAVSFLFALGISHPAEAGVAYGNIDQLNRINVNSIEAHGFESALDGARLGDVTNTFERKQYGALLNSEDRADPLHSAIRIQYASFQKSNGAWTAHTAIPSGSIAPTAGQIFTNPATNVGGKVFSIAYTGAPSVVKRHWLAGEESGKLALKPAVNAFRLGARNGGPVLAALRGTDTRPPAAPPTIIEASASPSVVVGKSTTLWVKAFDDQGGHLLSYFWQQTSGPSVASLSSASNGASTATFTQAGSYVFRVTVTNLIGGSAFADVPVTVNQTIASIIVTPPSATVNLLSTQQFTAAVLDQFGNSIASPGIAWNVSPALGSIDGSGFFTAGSTPGKGKVFATSGRTNGAADVTVSDGPPTIVSVTADPSPAVGQATTLTVVATDAAGPRAITGYSWTQTAGPFTSQIMSPSSPATRIAFTGAGDYTFQVTVTNAAGLSATGTVDAPAPAAWVYDPDQTDNPLKKTYAAPYDTVGDIQACAGEELLFNIRSTDTADRKKPKNTEKWEAITPGVGPYRITVTTSAGAMWDNKNGETQKVVNSLETGNLHLWTDKAWKGDKAITVTAKIEDLAPAAKDPDSGSTADAAVTLTWNIIKRDKAPTGMHQTDPAEVNKPRDAPAVYTYRMDPVPPHYQGQTVLETFQPVTANFKMEDLTDEWKKANPTLTTPDQVAVFLYGTSNNGTFVIDGSDSISDQHGGFGDVSPFTAAAQKAGIGYTKPQTYSVCGTTIGTCSIKRTYTDGKITITKTAP